MSRKCFWCFPLFLASVSVDKRSCARRAYTRKTWSRATCIHTLAGKGGITWQATRPNSVPLAQMPDWRSVCVPCFVVLILSHPTQDVKNFFSRFFRCAVRLPDVLLTWCIISNALQNVNSFFQKIFRLFFSQSHIWNAPARARVRYIRAKKILVWAC